MRTIHEFEIRNMLRMACDAMERAYVPKTKESVGACLKGSSGAYYMGCSIEDHTGEKYCCAESVAAGRAIYEGERMFDALAIVSSNEKGEIPCDACVRLLYGLDDGELPVICANRTGSYRIYALKELANRGLQED